VNWWKRPSIQLVGRRGEIGSRSDDDRLIRFYAPRYRLSRDRPERMGGKRQWVTIIGLREPYHFANFDDDFGERESALLLCDYLRPYRSTKRIDERKKPFVVPGNEIIGRPINGVFHECPGGEKGVASSAGMLPRDGGRSEMRAGGNFPHMIT
jgi:hypothetical protein